MKNSQRSSTRTRLRRLLDHPAGLCGLLALGTVLTALAGLRMGSVPLSPGELWEALRGGTGTTAGRILLYSRLPRVLASLLAGAALATAGALLQSVLANPLASPGLLGVNAGAGLLVALYAAFLSLGGAGGAASPAFSGAVSAASAAVPLLAFLGAALGVGLVLLISRRAGASRMSLVLTGVAVSHMFSAAIDAVSALCPDALNAYADFRVGGFAGVTLPRLLPAALLIGAGVLAALALARPLEILSLGDETAQSLGLPVRRVRTLALLTAAALAGAAVSFAGLLGFVGLVTPQMVRRLTRVSGGPMLLASALGGALLLTLCDLLARVAVRPYELPVGVVMSFVGGPFFIWLLFRQRGGRTHA